MSEDHKSAAAGGDAGDNLDAEFAAMMEGLDLPQDMRLDMEALDAARGEGPQPSGQSARGGAEGDAPTNDADSAQTPRAVKIAVVLTPLANADALAQLCAMSGLDCTVVPTRTGAVAVKELVSAYSEWDVSELLGGAESEPAEAAELAGRLSHLSRGGTILLTADLATDVGIESGLSGTITARGYERGEGGPDMSSGLVLASVDALVEDLLLGVAKANEVEGAVRSSQVRLGPLGRWMGRGLGRDKGSAPTD